MTDKYDKDKDKSSDVKTRTDSNGTYDPNRRRFIKNTGMVAGGVVGGSILGGFLTNQFFTKQEETQTKEKNATEDFQEARQFFTRFEDFVVLQMATERIFPKDDHGPGAIELGVPYFIDKQLAGPWGMNAKDYRQAPFIKFQQVQNMSNEGEKKLPPNPQGAQGGDQKPNTELERHQTRLSRREIFLQGIRKMNQESQDRFETTFDQVTEEEQIEILQDFESGQISMQGVAAENFFILLREATLEGAYSDPLYGGNKNMAGWKMKEFPGAQMSYANVIEKDEFAQLKPISLNSYQQH